MDLNSPSRRSFIGLALAGGFLSFVGLVWKIIKDQDEEDPYVARIEYLIQKELSFLKLDDNGLREFSLLHQQKVNREVPKDLLVQGYLLSSDFFINNQDESKTVHFLNYYDPNDGLCDNPFAKFDFD